ncbi:hypothetical protein ABT369_15485 [Dactylosporangium sp. NPDC000244]|uniref:hypothetical protein n=1 Tax=Dactylosporangium sp. NPDC000244 TaxID=3154365 RepID=UPI0033216B2B
MDVQEQLEDVELQLEVALALLPLIGRCVRVDGDREVHQRGNRLDDAEDRRALVHEVARRWSGLLPGQRRRYPRERAAAIAKFAADYVDVIELSELDEADYRAHGFDASMETVWRKHVEGIRRRDEAA